MNQLRRVLTAVDFSKPARAAFDHALAFSRTHNAELTVVHAVPAGHTSAIWFRSVPDWLGSRDGHPAGDPTCVDCARVPGRQDG